MKNEPVPVGTHSARHNFDGENPSSARIGMGIGSTRFLKVGTGTGMKILVPAPYPYPYYPHMLNYFNTLNTYMHMYVVRVENSIISKGIKN